MSDYFNDILTKFQCCFRKGFGAQNCLLYMIETIQKTRDNHDGFDESSLKVIISYLKNRTQTAKVGSSFSESLDQDFCYLYFGEIQIFVKVNSDYYIKMRPVSVVEFYATKFSHSSFLLKI